MVLTSSQSPCDLLVAVNGLASLPDSGFTMSWRREGEPMRPGSSHSSRSAVKASSRRDAGAPRFSYVVQSIGVEPMFGSAVLLDRIPLFESLGDAAEKTEQWQMFGPDILVRTLSV